jgi:hypothetical protein
MLAPDRPAGSEVGEDDQIHSVQCSGGYAGAASGADAGPQLLDQLQKVRHAGTPAQPVETPAAQPIGKNGGPTWTQGYQQRMTAKRITENLKKNAAPQPVASATAQSAVLAG